MSIHTPQRKSCLFITRCKREGGGRVRGSSFNACKAEFPAPWHGPSQNAQTSLARRRLGVGHGATPASRPRVEASVSSWPRTPWMHTPSQMRRRPATAANAPREAATNAIARPASPHVAASTSLVMLRIVPPPRIAPCVEHRDRMHRPMETSVLGVCERSDIVAVTKTSLGRHEIYYVYEITGQGPGLVNVQLTAISSQYTRQLTLTEGELDKFFGTFMCVGRV